MKDCPHCREAMNGPNHLVNFYRWRDASVRITACPFHFREIVRALDAAQKEAA
jgi:hypothetical protein